MRTRLLLPLLLLSAVPVPGAAQAGSCELVQSQALNYLNTGGPAVVSVAGPLRVVCQGGTTLVADSAVLYTASNEVHLFRNVDYRDPTRTLTSEYATYSSVSGRLFATGNVNFRDVTRGTTLRGPELEYYRAMEGRPQAQVIAGQRPHLTAVPKAGSRNREPLEIDADRITTLGENYFSASGRVVVHRSDLDATSDEATHDTQQEVLNLRGNAQIRGERFDLAGQAIDANMPGGKLDRVVARDRAELVSEKLRVDGPEIRLFFADDLLQRLVTRRGEAGAGERPLLTATGFRMEADSLEAILPGQRLERVVAIGKAIGERVDTAGAAPPQGTPPATGQRARMARGDRPAIDVVARDRDWVVGDTVTGYFIPADTAGARTARAADRSPEEEVELDRVVAKGSARSLYRVQEEDERRERPALNYLVGNEIELKLRDGEMDVANVRGLQRGVYLDPAAPGARPAAAPAAGTPPPGRPR